MALFKTFDHLDGLVNVRHGIFSRKGGVSPKPWDSLNLGLNCGDDPIHVIENRQRLLTALGGGGEYDLRGFFLHQVHGDGVLALKKGCGVQGDYWRPGSRGKVHEADAMVTDIPGLALVIQVADCQGVLLADPVRGVVAAVHSGWRGSIANIIGKTVSVMVKDFGANPGDILAGISPSLGPCCGEFVHYRKEIPERLWKYRINEGDCFDFWAMSRDQLTESGIPQGNIPTTGVCTRCENSQYFSYRKQKVTGRFGVAVSLV